MCIFVEDVFWSDCILLEGPIGAGKSHFARSLILALLPVPEDVPSPTFTLVQSYVVGSEEIWHCDLYRLSTSSEALELGLDAAMETAICLVEWPDRLDHKPDTALTLRFDTQGDGRLATLSSSSGKWAPLNDLIANV